MKVQKCGYSAPIAAAVAFNAAACAANAAPRASAVVAGPKPNAAAGNKTGAAGTGPGGQCTTGAEQAASIIKGITRQIIAILYASPTPPTTLPIHTGRNILG